MGRIPAIEECEPGLVPTEFNVVVYPETVEEKTAGGIFLPDKAKETEGLAVQNGRLVAVSPVAWTYADWPADARKPQAGDAVMFARYAGILRTDASGKEYRVIKDRDVVAVLTA
jgi:co-chaperonin GroES (HSP10)